MPLPSTTLVSFFKNQGDYVRALEYYQRSLRLKEELGQEEKMATSLNNIGNIYYFLDEVDKALEYMQRGLDLSEATKNEYQISSALNNIGLIYLKKGDSETAIDFFNRSLSLYKKLGSQKEIGAALNNLGLANKNLGNYDGAFSYYNQSLAVKKELGDQDGISRSYISIGENGLGYGNTSLAIKYCSKALEIAEKLGTIAQQEESCRCLYDAYKKSGSDDKALAYYEKMERLEDSLKSEEIAKKLQQMEFQKAVTEDSLKQVEKDLRIEMERQAEARKYARTRTLFLLALFVIFLVTISLYARYRYIQTSQKELQQEKDRSENLLLNILPAEVAEELKSKGESAAKHFENVSVLFTDFQDFTEMSESLSPEDLVSEINYCFKAFDAICERNKIEKIKTIGDSYMAAGGLPVQTEDSVGNTVMAAIEMAGFILRRKLEKRLARERPFEMRVGVHTGPVVAGIIGEKKFQYDIWGDTVNTASRMESHCEIGKVNISKTTYDLIRDDRRFTFKRRGEITVKGKGEFDMFYVSVG